MELVKTLPPNSTVPLRLLMQNQPASIWCPSLRAEEMADSMVTMVQILQVLKKIQRNLVDLKDSIEAESLVEEVQPEAELESKQKMAEAGFVPMAKVESATGLIGKIKVPTDTPSVYQLDTLRFGNIGVAKGHVVKRFSDYESNRNKLSCTPSVCVNISMNCSYVFVDAKFTKPPWKPPDLNLICVPSNEDFVSYYLKFEWFNEFANTMDSRGYSDFPAYVQAVELKDEVLEMGFSVDSKVYEFLMAGRVKIENVVGVFAVYEEFKEKLGVVENGYVPVICGLARCNSNDNLASWEAVKHVKRPMIHVFIATSNILGLLGSKMVIYVTYQVEFLPAADLIFVMKGGRITYVTIRWLGLCFGCFALIFVSTVAALLHAPCFNCLDSLSRERSSIYKCDEGV